MKILLSAFYQDMPPHTGGAALRGQSIINSLANILRDHNSCINVYCTTRNPVRISGAKIETLNVTEVANTMSLKRRVFGELRIGYSAAKLMFRGYKGPTLAIVSTPGYIAALVVILYARINRVPYVLDVRDIYPQVYAEANLLKRSSILYSVFLRISRWMYNGAELVLCATKGLAREIAYESPYVKVIHIYNGFPAYLAERIAIKHEKFTICFHGVLGFFQDVDTLISIAEKLGQYDVEVVVVGYGRKEAPLQNSSLSNLKFLGMQPFENTIALIERCHLGLCLRLDDEISKDSFPVKVWEYIGLGIPCIVTPHCEAGDFLEANDCGFSFKSGDIDGVVETVLKLKREVDTLNIMSSNCKLLSSVYTREKTGLTAATEIYKIATQVLH
jgi:glycosyltransferase involved in cell wall biosynthesis